MDFDKPKVYGDTSITDGLVLLTCCDDAIDMSNTSISRVSIDPLRHRTKHKINNFWVNVQSKTSIGGIIIGHMRPASSVVRVTKLHHLCIIQM